MSWEVERELMWDVEGRETQIEGKCMEKICRRFETGVEHNSERGRRLLRSKEKKRERMNG